MIALTLGTGFEFSLLRRRRSFPSVCFVVNFHKLASFFSYNSKVVGFHPINKHRRTKSVLEENYLRSPLGRDLKPAISFRLDHTQYDSLLGDLIMLNYSEKANQSNCLKYQEKKGNIYVSYMYLFDQMNKHLAWLM